MTTGVVNSGMLPTFRTDDAGLVEWLSQSAFSAGQVGALTIAYNGSILYINGGRVGINTDIPQQALDVHGNVRLRSVTDGQSFYLSADKSGNLLTT